MERKDNFAPSDIDLNLDGIQFDNIKDEEPKWLTEEPVMEEKNAAVVEEKVVAASATEPKKDFYNHRKKSIVQKNRDEKLREQFKDLEAGDNIDIENLKKDRRAFSEKLENDPEFREKYISEEEKKRLEREMQEAETLLDKIQKSTQTIRKNVLTDVEPLPEPDGDIDDTLSEAGSFIGASPYDDARKMKNERVGGASSGVGVPPKTGVYINHVEQLVINIHL